MIRYVLTALAMSVAGPGSGSAEAQSGIDLISAHILPGWPQPDGSRIAGIALDLAPGWKTYWRAPGDAGIPPRFDWTGSRNLGAVRIVWPTPEIMDQNGMVSIGYTHDVVLPIVVRPRADGQPVRLRAEIELGVCKEICVPARLAVSGTLPDGQGDRTPAIVAALVDQPMTQSESGVRNARCTIGPADGGLSLRAEIAMPSAGAPEFAVIESANRHLWIAEARTSRTGGTLVAETFISHVEGKPFALDRSDLRITVLGSDHAVDIQGCTGR